MRENIGRYIKERREELQLTQDDIALATGYKHKSSINKIELGIVDVPRKKIPAFALALNVSEEELLGYDYDPDVAALSNILRPDEFALLTAYRSASNDVRTAVLRALGVR